MPEPAWRGEKEINPKNNVYISQPPRRIFLPFSLRITSTASIWKILLRTCGICSSYSLSTSLSLSFNPHALVQLMLQLIPTLSNSPSSFIIFILTRQLWVGEIGGFQSSFVKLWNFLTRRNHQIIRQKTLPKSMELLLFRTWRTVTNKYQVSPNRESLLYTMRSNIIYLYDKEHMQGT